MLIRETFWMERMTQSEDVGIPRRSKGLSLDCTGTLEIVF